MPRISITVTQEQYDSIDRAVSHLNSAPMRDIHGTDTTISGFCANAAVHEAWRMDSENKDTAQARARLECARIAHDIEWNRLVGNSVKGAKKELKKARARWAELNDDLCENVEFEHMRTEAAD